MIELNGKKVNVWRENPNTGKDQLFTRVVKDGFVKIEETYYILKPMFYKGEQLKTFRTEYSHY